VIASLDASRLGGYGRSVGVTFTTVRVSSPRSPGEAARAVEVLVDTGALYSVIPRPTLEALGIAPMARETFTFADGTHRRYAVGEAFFQLGEKAGTSKVVFGPRGATPLLGALALESLGLMVNPVTREIAPMRLIRRACSAPERLHLRFRSASTRSNSSGGRRSTDTVTVCSPPPRVTPWIGLTSS
jgi:predicted aspartyl protease